MASIAATYGLNIQPMPSWPSSGNPTPTPGTPTLISTAPNANSDYNSFPSLAVDSASKLHLCYRKGGDHNSVANGDLLYRTKPLGGAWSADEVAVAQSAHPGLIVTDAALCILPNGDVLLDWHSVDNGTGARVNYRQVRSSGVWGAPVEFGTSDFPTGQITSGGGAVIDGSTILNAVYARTAGSGLRGISLYEASTSAPTAVTLRKHVVGAGYLSLDWEEPCTFRRSDGLGIILIRDDVTDKLYSVWTPDWSRFSVPAYSFDGFGKPNAGINPSNDMLCITRHPTDHRAVFSFNAQSGRAGAWTAIDYVDDNDLGSMMYGAVCWVPGRGWVGVYATAGVKDSDEEYIGPCHLYEVDFS